MDSSTVTRRPCFTDGDDGLASLAEAGFSGNHHHVHNHHHNFFSRPMYYRSTSLRSLSSFSSSSSSVSSPRSGKYEELRPQPQPHFLEACFLCKKPLGNNKDIFMYRGDTPFCSEECRQEQIEIDESKEKNWNLSSSMKALRKDQKKSKSTSPNKAQNYPFPTGTVAAA